MNKLFKHLRTVHKHRKYVRQMCWKMGLFWQGITHDLSKYSITELKIAKYYGGDRSPHAIARDTLGYSPSWLHHYHKNKHHWQFWLDIEDWPDKVIPIKMPYKYVIEMFCDFVGAGKAYSHNKWSVDMPLNYWINFCEGKRAMHADSEWLLKELFIKLKDLGMHDFLAWYKDNKKFIKLYYTQNQMQPLKQLFNLKIIAA